MDLSLQLAGLQQTEQLIGVVLELFTGLNVSEESWTGDFNTLGGEFTVKILASSATSILSRNHTEEGVVAQGRWHYQTKR